MDKDMLFGFKVNKGYAADVRRLYNNELGKHDSKYVFNLNNYLPDKEILILRTIMSLQRNFDEELFFHSLNTGILSVIIAKRAGIADYYYCLPGGLLHDVGKFLIPRPIMRKPGNLTDVEYKIVMQHPIDGHWLLAQYGVKTKAILDAVLHHHVRWDGEGYPPGVSKEDILPTTFVVSICDIFDAMCADRVYSKRQSFEDAVVEMASSVGTQLHPDLLKFFLNKADVFYRLIQKSVQVRQCSRYKTNRTNLTNREKSVII